MMSLFFWADLGDWLIDEKYMSLLPCLCIALCESNVFNKGNKFSRSVADAIDYQLDLLGYIIETMWVILRLRLHQQRYCSTVLLLCVI
jgi:hypothetical protein